MSLSRDMSGHVGTLSGHFAYVRKYHEDKCLVLETCRDISQDIYILGNFTREVHFTLPLVQIHL
eukprot:scaffold92898_cov46-Cyclotella_meneghiniana.AAC.1